MDKYGATLGTTIEMVLRIGAGCGLHTVQEAFRALAEQCWEKYGILVKDVHFDWLNLSNVNEEAYHVRQLSMDSTYTGYKP